MTNQCPFCKSPAEEFTSIEGRPKPIPGDPSICFKCAALATVGDDGLLIEPSSEQISLYKAQPGLWPQIEQVQKAIRKHRQNIN